MPNPQPNRGAHLTPKDRWYDFYDLSVYSNKSGQPPVPGPGSGPGYSSRHQSTFRLPVSSSSSSRTQTPNEITTTTALQNPYTLVPKSTTSRAPTPGAMSDRSTFSAVPAARTTTTTAAAPVASAHKYQQKNPISALPAGMRPSFMHSQTAPSPSHSQNQIPNQNQTVLVDPHRVATTASCIGNMDRTYLSASTSTSVPTSTVFVPRSSASSGRKTRLVDPDRVKTTVSCIGDMDRTYLPGL